MRTWYVPELAVAALTAAGSLGIVSWVRFMVRVGQYAREHLP